VYDVPCHTRGHVLYHVTSKGDDDNNSHMNDEYSSLFTGDTLFVAGVGHFFEGEPYEMLNNFQKISNFNDNVKIYPGHEYAISNLHFGIFIEENNENMKKKN